MVDLTVRDLMFYHPFGSKDIKKLIDLRMFYLISSTERLSVAIAVASQGPFLILNLTVFNNSWTLLSIFSFSRMKLGCCPTELTCFPTILINLSFRVSETKRTSYFLAHFLTILFSLERMFNSSISLASILRALA